MVFIHSILQKLRSALKNERGEANYFSTVVFIFIAVVLLAFIIDLFGIKIIIAVVLGALLLAALTLIFNDTVIPRITSEIEGLFG